MLVDCPLAAVQMQASNGRWHGQGGDIESRGGLSLLFCRICVTRPDVLGLQVLELGVRVVALLRGHDTRRRSKEELGVPPLCSTRISRQAHDGGLWVTTPLSMGPIVTPLLGPCDTVHSSTRLFVVLATVGTRVSSSEGTRLYSSIAAKACCA